MRGGCGCEVVLETVNAAARLPHHRLRLPGQRAGAGPAHQSPVHLRFPPHHGPGAVRSRLLDAVARKKKARRFHRELHLRSLDLPPLPGLFQAGLARPRKPCASRPSPTRAQSLLARARFLRRHVRNPRRQSRRAGRPARRARRGPNWPAPRPTRAPRSSTSCMAKDDGWLASLYDALARIHGPVQDYLTEPARMKRFYTAVRGRITSPGPARPVFRSNTDMMLLTTRLRVDPNGKPHIPGSLEVWRNLFANHPQGKYDGKLTKSATNWKEPDDVLEALFALCRKAVENEPLKIFMALSDLDRNRTTPLDRRHRGPPGPRLSRPTAASTRSSANRAALREKSIVQFLDADEAINKVQDPLLRCRPCRYLPVAESVCGRSSCASRAFREAQADAVFSGIVGVVRPGAQRTRTVRCGPQRREDCCWRRPAAIAMRRPAGATCSTLLAGDRASRCRNARPDGRRRSCASWKRSASFRSIPCSSWPITSRPSPRARSSTPRWSTSWPAASAKSSCRAPRSPPPKRTPWASATGPTGTSMPSAS